MEALFGIFEVDCAGDTESDIIQRVESLQVEIDRYRKQKVEINEDPLARWRANQSIYAEMASLARKRLSIAGTSVPSECLFSAAGNLLSAKRPCLSSDNVDMLLFLNKNLE